MTQLDEILAVHSMVVVGTAATVVVICLVVLVNQNWLFGVFLVAIAFCSMFQTFLIGQVYEVTSDEFIVKLCFIEWNAMLPRHRKMLRLILQMAQCPKLTTLCGIAPNNLNMFLQVSKDGSWTEHVLPLFSTAGPQADLCDSDDAPEIRQLNGRWLTVPNSACINYSVQL